MRAHVHLKDFTLPEDSQIVSPFHIEAPALGEECLVFIDAIEYMCEDCGSPVYSAVVLNVQEN